MVAKQSKKFVSHSAILQDTELFADPTPTNVNGTELLNIIRRIKVLIREDTNSEYPAVDLLDTLPWISHNTTGVPVETPKPAVPTDASHWYQISARPKTSTAARSWSDVARRGHRSSR